MSHSSPVSVIDVAPGQPALVRAAIVRAEAGGTAAAWATGHRDALRAAVAEFGCVLVRGLGLRDAAETGAVFRGLAGSLMTEREAFAPRRPYPGGVYSATPWPPNQQMCMHHELSYALEVPGLMMFACLSPAASGGATGVADAAAVLSALPAELVQRFEQEGWMLGRNYHEDIGASVEQAFGTGDRRVVEHYCRANAIEFEWQPDGGLRTRQRRSAVVRHPRHRPALLVQPDRFPERADDRPRGPRVPGGHLRRGRAAVHHPFRQRRPDRRGHRAPAQRDLRGPHHARAVAVR